MLVQTAHQLGILSLLFGCGCARAVGGFAVFDVSGVVRVDIFGAGARGTVSSRGAALLSQCFTGQTGKARSEHKISALPLKADIGADIVFVRSVP